MRQTILVVAALMLVLSAALFAVSLVHALGSDCPGKYAGVDGSAVAASASPGGLLSVAGALDPQTSCISDAYNLNFPGYTQP
jgi:hypothetical protein